MQKQCRPQRISGVLELLPEEQLAFDKFRSVVLKHFQRYGAAPIETPAFEREEVLRAKGGDEIRTQIFSLSRFNGATEDTTTGLGLHYDLTVPLARYVAQRSHDLTFPFRRSQIQPVWRGERAQAGRYREFYQADYDIVGDGSLDITADAEPPAIINSIFDELAIGEFRIRISNRKILQGFLVSLNLSDLQATKAMQLVDRLDKRGRAAVQQMLTKDAALTEQAANDLLEFVSHPVPLGDIRGALRTFSDNAMFETGLAELSTVIEYALLFGVPPERLKVDLSVARGLDYYTGTVYETHLVSQEIGSICSGGRYDDLAGYFTDRQFPGVGISIGLTRLVPRLLQCGILQSKGATPALALLTTIDHGLRPYYATLATTLRKEGIPVELYLEQHKLSQQLRYASRKGFPYALIVGADEHARGSVQVRNLQTGTQLEVMQNTLAAMLGAERAG